MIVVDAELGVSIGVGHFKNGIIDDKHGEIIRAQRPFGLPN